MSKHDLRHDAFADFTAKTTEFLQERFMSVLVGVAVLAAAVVGTIYFQQSRARSHEQASQLMHKATTLYSAGSYSEGLLTLDEIMSRFGGTKQGAAATYFAGASHLALGESDAAVERFRSYLDSDDDGIYATSARSGLALALEARGDHADAAQAYRDLRQSLEESDPLYTQACFGEARVLERLGQLNEAAAALEPVARGDDFQARQDAESRIAVLKARANTTS